MADMVETIRGAAPDVPVETIKVIVSLALNEAADRWATGEWADAFTIDQVHDDISAVKSMEKWLRSLT